MLRTNIEIKNIPAADEAAERLKRNIQFFCQTPRGSLPQMRDYGIDYSFLGENASVAKRKLTVEIISGIRDQFGIQISNIYVSEDAENSGGYIAEITI